CRVRPRRRGTTRRTDRSRGPAARGRLNVHGAQHMGVRSRGRGVAATFGLLLVLVGIAGVVVLWVMAERRPEQAVEGFARGPVGCTTTLEFGDVGTFYLYEELVGTTSDAFAECAPSATPGSEFSVELLDDGRPIPTRADRSITYDTDAATGTSVARV